MQICASNVINAKGLVDEGNPTFLTAGWHADMHEMSSMHWYMAGKGNPILL